MPLAEWKDRKLRELVVENGLQTGPFGGQLHAHEYVADGVPVVMPQDIHQGAISSEHVARITEAKAASLSQHRLRAGDLVFARRGDIGRVGLAHESHTGWLCGTGCLRARLSKESYSEFVEKAVRTDQSIAWLNVHAVGQTMLNLNTATLGQLPLRMPPLPEQHLIADVLNTIVDAIRKTEKLIQKLKQMKQGLRHDLLTRGIDENGELRDPERHPEQFKDSPLGRIPKKWDLLRIGSAGAVRLGRQRSPQYDQGPHMRPYLRVVNIFEDELDLRDVNRMHFSPMDFERHRLQPGDVLLTEGDLGSAMNVGRSAVFRGEIVDCCIQNSLLRFRLNGPGEPDFFHYAFCHLRLKGVFALATMSTTVFHLSAGRLVELPIAVPEPIEQAAIASALRDTDLRLAAERTAMHKLRVLKQGLMEDLLTGRVRTTVLDGAVS